MRGRDLDTIAKAAKGSAPGGLFEDNPNGTLAEYPELEAVLRNEGYHIRSSTPAPRLQMLCRMLLQDRYKDEQFAN